jgi:peptide/nickel transport system permease protein
LISASLRKPGNGERSGAVARRRTRRPILASLGRRLAAGVATLLVASFVIFFALNVLPGDVATALLGREATPTNTAALRHELHLDHPFLERYVDWLGDAVRGDLGRSAVAQDIGTPFRNTMILAGIAIVLLVPLSLLLGVFAGAYAGRPADYGISYIALVMGAFPEFVLGTLLILVFFTVLNWFPPVALVGPGQTPLTQPDTLVLPVLTLLGVSLGFSARQIRAGMVEVMRQDYVTMARLNGLPERRVFWRYGLRNALAATVQVFAQTIQYLIGGIIIVESVFSYPGIGTFLVNAVAARDVPEVEAVAIILAAVYILINIFADLIVVLLVPKLRTGLA